jgi:hypothetical protein
MKRQRVILEGDPAQYERMLASLSFCPAEVGRHRAHIHTYTRGGTLPDAKFLVYRTKRSVVVRQEELTTPLESEDSGCP